MTATLTLTTRKQAVTFTLSPPRLWQPMSREREPNPPRSFRTEAPFVTGQALYPDTAAGRRQFIE